MGKARNVGTLVLCGILTMGVVEARWHSLSLGLIKSTTGELEVLAQFDKLAVLDKETGLGWQRQPKSATSDWAEAMTICKAWRFYCRSRDSAAASECSRRSILAAPIHTQTGTGAFQAFNSFDNPLGGTRVQQVIRAGEVYSGTRGTHVHPDTGIVTQQIGRGDGFYVRRRLFGDWTRFEKLDGGSLFDQSGGPDGRDFGAFNARSLP